MKTPDEAKVPRASQGSLLPKHEEGGPCGAAVADLAGRILERIRAEGPISFRDWMEACLFDPDDGYYMVPGRKTGAETDADFATSPTLHPFMGQAVGREVEAAWTAAGALPRWDVVEFGGGEGDLARAALAWVDEASPELAAAVHWTHVEVSPVHREAQASADRRIRQATEAPPRFAGMVVAHEFVDALPVHVLEWRKGHWAEIRVGLDGDDQFMESFGIPSRRAITAAPKRVPADGQRVTAMVDAKQWLHDIASKLDLGRILIVDYGDRGGRLWVPERPEATVRGFRDHQMVAPLAEGPGTCDITTSVDFTQLREWGINAGLAEISFESQEEFLMRHGVMETLASAPKDTVEEASEYLRLKQMMLPGGMGAAFKVQILER